MAERMGFVFLQTSDGRDVILPNGLNTYQFNASTIQFSPVETSYGFKGYFSTVVKAGDATTFDRTQANITELSRIAAGIRGAMSVSTVTLSADVVYEITKLN